MQLREAVSSHSDGSDYLLSAASIIITLIQVLTHSKLLHSFIIVLLQLMKVHKLFSSILNRIDFFFFLSDTCCYNCASFQPVLYWFPVWVGRCVHVCAYLWVHCQESAPDTVLPAKPHWHETSSSKPPAENLKKLDRGLQHILYQ